MTFNIRCDNCKHSGDVALPDAGHGYGLLCCPNCGAVVTSVDVAPWSEWIDHQVSRKSSLATRKQDYGRSDHDVSRIGIAAELAAALVLCPAHVNDWLKLTEAGAGNRGRDLPCELTSFDKPVEVKQTVYHSDTAGFLLVRPPRLTPGDMKVSYLDDSYYVLAIGGPTCFTIAGWIDRDGLVKRGRLNPVPNNGRQRECWGIHWKQLLSLNLLTLRLREPRFRVPTPYLGEATNA